LPHLLNSNVVLGPLMVDRVLCVAHLVRGSLRNPLRLVGALLLGGRLAEHGLLGVGRLLRNVVLSSDKLVLCLLIIVSLLVLAQATQMDRIKNHLKKRAHTRNPIIASMYCKDGDTKGTCRDHCHDDEHVLDHAPSQKCPKDSNVCCFAGAAPQAATTGDADPSSGDGDSSSSDPDSGSSDPDSGSF